MIRVALIVVILTVLAFHNAYADQIFTTVRSNANTTIFDGKWTFEQEWKDTSATNILFNDGNQLELKTGHDYKNLYVLLDFVTQHKIFKHSDYGLVCITTNLNNESRVQMDDYCFLVTAGSTNPITLQRDSNLGQTNYFSKVDYSKLVAAGGISDTHDRYSSIPHTTYEFKIPLDIVGVSDKYKFFVAVYDTHQNKMYTWPQNISEKSFPYITASSNWGDLVSPDKSLPEFPWPFLIMVLSFPAIIFITRVFYLDKQ